MNLPPNESSDNNVKNSSDKKKKKTTPKTHDGQFNMQAIIKSVAGIGLGSANDFSFANIANNQNEIQNDTPNEIQNKKLDLELDTPIPVKPSIEEKPVKKKPVQQTTKRTASNITKRSKKVNKAKLQKVFKTDAFKKSNRTIRILPGLSKLVRKSSDRSAREIVSELLIKWLMKEHPQFEPALLQLLDQHLDQG